jgi:hypothetical protein
VTLVRATDSQGHGGDFLEYISDIIVHTPP